MSSVLTEPYHLPKDEAARQALGATMGEDGLTLLGAIEAAIDRPWLGKVPVVETLRQVWAEQYTTPPGPILFREKKDLDSSADLIVSPYDTEALLTHQTRYGMDRVRAPCRCRGNPCMMQERLRAKQPLG